MDRAVFINYRGQDSHSTGALLYHGLIGHFGEDLVFLDAESIPAGADFVEELLVRVRSARVLLAVIGSRWLTATDPAGRRRLDDPADWIHRELAEAFTAGVRVIPVLTDDANLPCEADLPVDIAALSRCQYRHLRYRESTADLARIVTDLTSLDPVLAAAARIRDNAPRQLLTAPGMFTGRGTELAALTEATSTTPDTTAIAAIGGAGGIGKTALALHWAYQHLNRFPDGQLYVDLRGFDPSGDPVSAGEAVRGFLDALGVDPVSLPVDLATQAARYRSLVAGKKMLIVLDNARDLDQITPLLPGSPTCTVLITSRRHLAGLAALHKARLLDLDALPEPEARELLAHGVGARRLAAEPAAAAELLALCAGLPLAVRIVAALAASHPTFPLAALAKKLRDTTARLDQLNAGELHANLRAVLSWSVHTLSPPAASLFSLLGIAPGPDTSLPAVASLAGQPVGHVEAVLQELEHASLLQQHAPGRYRMHDLIRLYATEAAHRDDPEIVEAALRRVLDFYTHTAYAAERLLNPHRPPIQLDPPAPDVQHHPLPDDPAALEWFDVEHSVLLAGQHTATRHAWHRTAWQLAWTLSTFHARRGHRHNHLAVWQTALDAAAHLPDPTLRIQAHRLLGYACTDLGRHDEGIGHLHRVLALAQEQDDIDQQARTHRILAVAWERQGNDRRGLEHATRALELHRTLNQPVWEAEALNMVGWFAARVGDYDTARASCQAALALLRCHHHPVGEAGALDSLGYIAHHTGHHHEAIDYHQQALTMCRAHGITYEIATTLDNLGHPQVAIGEYEQARAAWQEALKLYQEQGRNTDTTRVQQQLDDLDKQDDARSPAASATE